MTHHLGDVASDLRRIDVDGANEPEALAIDYLPGHAGANRTETDEEDADLHEEIMEESRRAKVKSKVKAKGTNRIGQLTRRMLARRVGVDSRHQQALVSPIDNMTRHDVPDLLPGTLDLLILRTLQTQSLHGWAISERIQQISQDVLQINQGSLYPALHRLEHKGWIEAEWAVSELGRRAKYYRLTASGRRQLAVEASAWERMSAAIGRVMKLA